MGFSCATRPDRFSQPTVVNEVASNGPEGLFFVAPADFTSSFPPRELLKSGIARLSGSQARPVRDATLSQAHRLPFRSARHFGVSDRRAENDVSLDANNLRVFRESPSRLSRPGKRAMVTGDTTGRTKGAGANCGRQASKRTISLHWRPE